MKNILLICIVLTLGTIQVYGQEISYGTGQWEPQGLGYHRAVIYVSKKAEAVKVKIPWRRLEQKLSLELDWRKLGMDATRAKIEIPQIENLQGEGVADIKHLTIPASKGLILIISQ